MIVRPNAIGDPSAYGFSQAVVAPAGTAIVFIAGQLADSPEGDFQSQVQAAFKNLEMSLEAAGATAATVLKITCLVVDHDSERHSVVNEARGAFFGVHRPASTLIPVPRLAGEGLLFEIDAIAATTARPNPE